MQPRRSGGRFQQRIKFVPIHTEQPIEEDTSGQQPFSTGHVSYSCYYTCMCACGWVVNGVGDGASTAATKLTIWKPFRHISETPTSPKCKRFEGVPSIQMCETQAVLRTGTAHQMS
jgi:hypothetical protein